MIAKMPAIAALGFAFLAAPLAAQDPTPLPAPDSTKLMTLGHTYMRRMLAGKTDSLIGAMTKEFLEGIGGTPGVAEQVAMLAERGGRETGAAIEKLTRRNGNPQFWHEANFEQFVEEPLVIRIVFEADGRIAGIGMGPKSRAKWDH